MKVKFNTTLDLCIHLGIMLDVISKEDKRAKVINIIIIEGIISIIKAATVVDTKVDIGV